MLSSSNKEWPDPGTLPIALRLAIRQHLLEIGAGAEVALIVIDGQPKLRLLSTTTIAEMGFSVRLYNCLKAASIKTLDELLLWKPSQLMELPHFGRNCLMEVLDGVHKLGYRWLGDEAIAKGGGSALPSQRDCDLQTIIDSLAENGVSADTLLGLAHNRSDMTVASLITIAEMDLSIRSYNCLKAASIETLDDLLKRKPAQLMKLRNFGSKCLREVVEAVHKLGYPSFGDEGDAECVALMQDAQIESAPQAISQYFAEAGADGGLALCMANIKSTSHFAGRKTIANMGLSVRTNNCLKAASIATLDELLALRPAQLMELPNFGRTCLNEIRDVLYQLGFTLLEGEADSVGAQREAQQREESAPLAGLLDVRELISEKSITDRFVELGWYTVSDLAAHSQSTIASMAGMSVEERLEFGRALYALALELPTEIPTWFLYNTSALRAAFHVELEQLKLPLAHRGIEAYFWEGPRLSWSLNEDILQLIPKYHDERKRKIISDLLGLGGSDPLTLEDTANAQTPPLTRERVRQIALPVTDALVERGCELPWLLKAVAELERLVPCDLKHATQVLIEARVLDAPLTVAAILGLAQRSNLPHGLILEGSYLLNKKAAELLSIVTRTAAKLSAHWGVADWQEIEQLVPDNEASLVKAQLQGVVWLDVEQRYLVLPSRENSLANRLARILTVTPRLKLVEAYRGVFRDRRMQEERMPEGVFSAFCSAWPWCRVEGDEVQAKTGLPHSAVSGDDLLVLLMREIGHPIRWRDLTNRAEEQGISLGTVTQALTNSNVIASANGYYAVIGDPTLAEYGRREIDVSSETPKSTIEFADGGLVPHANSDDFPGLLMTAVQERIAALELITPWSVSELRLTEHDRDRLLQWGQLAEWDFRDDSGNYKTRSGEKVRKRAALGLAFLLVSSEAVRRFGDCGSVWPAIDRALGERQQDLFMVRPGIPKASVREAVEDACRTFGLRHGFEDVGQQVWVRTLWLQFGLACSQLNELTWMLTAAMSLQPLAVQLLTGLGGPNVSASFQASWRLLQDVRLGAVSEPLALKRFGVDTWLSPFPAGELLAQCLKARHSLASDSTAGPVIAADDTYNYFSTPVLRWASDEAYLEYGLNEWAPQWCDSSALVVFCEDPFRRERIPIEGGRWKLQGGPVRVPLTRREKAGFDFKLMQGKEEVFAGWKHVCMLDERPFTFFRASGSMVSNADDVPLGEEVVLLHSAEMRVVGLDASPVFRAVLRGKWRLTQLPKGAVTSVRLMASGGEAIWSLPVLDERSSDEEMPILSVCDGKWGTPVEVALPEVPFIVQRLRLNNGEELPISNANGRAWLAGSPGLGRAQTGRLCGPIGQSIGSAKVKLNHVSQDFGAALEIDGKWQPLDGSATLDSATMRTQRLLAKVKGPVGGESDLCWMEGSRTLAGLRSMGTLLTGAHGLGECLNLVQGTYNSSEIQVSAARAVLDSGFLRSVQLEADGSWSAHLPFEEPLEEGHSLWIWAEDSPFPRKFPRDRMEKSGFTLRWSSDTESPVFGWAFSFNGARIGSIVRPQTLNTLIQNLTHVPWGEAAMWLRWWHVPVLHADVRGIMANLVRKHPLETMKAWLLPGHEQFELILDEFREEAWNSATREYLWGWRPDPEQAVELVKAVGIWTGDIEHDSRTQPSFEAVGLLVRMSPILLADTVARALPKLHEFPKSQLAVLVGWVLQAVNPNATDSGFRLDQLCERYARGESRLDGRFIMTSLIDSARALLHGEQPDVHNLKLAFHQAGLRELISVALLYDVYERWRNGNED
jgi:DNA-directed RNA polymerase alpha subunit